MIDTPSRTYTAFDGFRRLAAGPLQEIALALKRAAGNGGRPILIYDDSTGLPLDIDTRGTDEEVLARFSLPIAAEARGRGRPKLGVVAREVTLLPRHWDWLNAQPGGASVALRSLVDNARRAGGEQTRRRAAQDAAYHFMSAIAGDLPGFEDAIRALYAGDRERLENLIAAWPDDIRGYACKLAYADN
jgi:hypothetical protein